MHHQREGKRGREDNCARSRRRLSFAFSIVTVFLVLDFFMCGTLFVFIAATSREFGFCSMIKLHGLVATAAAAATVLCSVVDGG